MLLRAPLAAHGRSRRTRTARFPTRLASSAARPV